MKCSLLVNAPFLVTFRAPVAPFHVFLPKGAWEQNTKQEQKGGVIYFDTVIPYTAIWFDDSTFLVKTVYKKNDDKKELDTTRDPSHKLNINIKCPKV